MLIAQVEDNKIEIKEYPRQKLLKRKGAIVNVLGCGLCGSDIVKFKHGVKNGTVLGHEIVATIAEIDSETDFKIGDRIVTSHHIPCFNCTYCEHENYSMCSHFKKTNIFPGGFSEMVYVSEEHLKNVAYKVPDEISNEEISFYEPLACCIRAIKRCQLKSNDTALVVGLGSIGLLMAKALKSFGYNVYGCDILESRITSARAHGIESFNSKDINSLRNTINYKTQNYGVDSVFMTSGADKAIDVALNTIKMGGKIMVFSSTPQNLGYANNEIYYKELTILGSYSPSPKDLEDSFKLITENKINLKGVTTSYPLSKIQNAFEDTISNKVFKAYIKIAKNSDFDDKHSNPINKQEKIKSGKKPFPTIHRYNDFSEKHIPLEIDLSSQSIESNSFQIRNSKIFLPQRDNDLIQSCIYGSGNYWDTTALSKIDKLLEENATILDIGANIGNHSLYWASERKAQKIYSFEPYPSSYQILKTNIDINNLNNIIEALPFALSDENTKAQVCSFCPTNIGGTGFSKNSEGDFEFRTLDSLNIKEMIDLIKIDVEGCELEVLNGGLNTIKKNKPIILIETFDKKEKIEELLTPIGYTLVDANLAMCDYIYQCIDEK